MPTAAEDAWQQLCMVVQETLSETDLVLLSLPNLRSLMAHHGFTPLTAARAEVQWQVLQSTHASARKREYEESVRSGSPCRSTTPPPPPPPPPPAAVSAVSHARRASPSPRRELGSREGVASPRSLRTPRGLSPSSARSYQYPVQHAAPFEVPKVSRGPHLSRRACLSPRNARDEEGPLRGEGRQRSGPSPCAAGSDPNELGAKAAVKVSSLKAFGGSGAACDPNTTSYDKQDPPAPSIRKNPAGLADSNPFGPATPPPPSRQKFLPSERIPAVSDPNETVGSFTQKPRTGHYPRHPPAPPASCNPNPSEVRPGDVSFFIRKGRGDKGRTTEEPIKTFNPTPGPPEQGVIPGTYAWEVSKGDMASPASCRKQVGRSSPPAASDPNDVLMQNGRQQVRFIGGKAAVKACLSHHHRESVVMTAGAASPPPPPQGVAASANPNQISTELGQQRFVGPASPPEAWEGPGADLPAPPLKVGKRAAMSCPPVTPGISEVSHSLYVHKKADHLVSGKNAGAREYTPRFVPT